MSRLRDEPTDGLMISLAQQTGGIQQLLTCMFSFLKRRTDFYHILEPGGKVGFPPGVAEQMVLAAYRQFLANMDGVPTADQLASYGERVDKSAMASSPGVAAGASVGSQDAAPAPKPTAKPTAETTRTTAKASTTPQPAPKPGGSGAEGASTDGGRVANPDAARGAGAAGESQATPAPSAGANNIFSTYNGGACSNYLWSQTLSETNLQIDLWKSGAERRFKGKDVDVKITKTHLTVGVKGLTPLVDGELGGEIKKDVAMWNLEDGRYVNVNLDKRIETWWKSAVEGDDEIDTTKVDSTKQITEYDGEVQATLRKIMFDQNQKAQGLPTSDEIKNEDLLRKAWNAEGSPFKGTPFDPKALHISGVEGGLPPFMGGADDAGVPEDLRRPPMP